jgi:hypothetical protein
MIAWVMRWLCLLADLGGACGFDRLRSAIGPRMEDPVGELIDYGLTRPRMNCGLV